MFRALDILAGLANVGERSIFAADLRTPGTGAPADGGDRYMVLLLPFHDGDLPHPWRLRWGCLGRPYNCTTRAEAFSNTSLNFFRYGRRCTSAPVVPGHAVEPLASTMPSMVGGGQRPAVPIGER